MAEIVSGTLGVHAVNITNFEVDPGDLDISAADINDATAVGISLMTATDAAAGRTAIGAGTSSLALGTTSSTALAGDYAPTWDDVTGKPAVIGAGEDAVAARTAIGAGTSSLALGTSGTTALAGNTTASGITATPVPGGSATTVQGILEELEARIADLEPPSP